MSDVFNYDEFITRNIGFVTPEQQTKLKNATVFIPGVGGMGGTLLATLARLGVENFIIADIDTFEVSNLNRQIFSSLTKIGHSKADVAASAIKDINPNIKIQVLANEWVKNLDQILPKVDIVVNGCDDVIATVTLMRKAKAHGKTVVDAFASSLASVYVVKPNDPRPEEFMNFPTRNKKTEDLTPQDHADSAFCELVYVIAHTSTLKHVHMKYAGEMVTGKRKRISMAPMVWLTGIMMSYEVMKVLLDIPKVASYRGVFCNSWTFKFEKVRPWPWNFIKYWIVKTFLKKL
jgi:molybdopterin-synthase adenylyltransferase